MRTIQFGSIYHMPWLEYRHALPDGRVCLRLKTGRGEFSRVAVRVTSNYAMPDYFKGADEYEMAVAYRDEWHDFYEVIFFPRDLRIKYLFVLQSDELTFKLDATGLKAGADAEEDVSQAFAFAYVYPAAPMPEWARGCVGYQIFPDRFARERDWTPREPEARRGTHRFLVRDWDTPVFYPRAENGDVSSWPFWGGTLRGIEEKLPYLASLGVTVLYLNPIFEAASNHRYDTADYTRVDPLLGRKKDFESLCEAARKRGIRIVLDGVFNHTGADSVYFDKFGNYGTAEKYRSWFRFGEQYRHGYECWWDVPDLPNVEENDPSFREFLCGKDGVVRRWLRRGASGWRLDVADELPDSLIRDIRAAMKEEKEDSLLLGEVWEDASNKVSYGALREYFLGSELDATMHYPFRTAVLDFLLGKIHAQAACDAFWTIQEHYPKENLHAALNLIGSHDRARVLTVLAAM